MKIENDKSIVQLDPKVSQGQQDQLQSVKPADNKTSANLGQEKVSISKQAINIKQVENELEGVPDVRMDVVDRIKAEVEAGTYNRPAKDVADAILNTSLIESLYR